MLGGGDDGGGMAESRFDRLGLDLLTIGFFGDPPPLRMLPKPPCFVSCSVSHGEESNNYNLFGFN